MSSTVQQYVDLLLQNALHVDSELLPVSECIGRFLSADILSDRDSPACDVSAMDGYALRSSDWTEAGLPIQSIAAAGMPPQQIVPQSAIQIFTGAAVPFGSDCVIKREDVVEEPDRIYPRNLSARLEQGTNIRHRGENQKAGEQTLPKNTLVTSAVRASLANTGTQQVRVFRKVRVSILTTGDELRGPEDAVESWQIRDSNGPFLETWISRIPSVSILRRRHVPDRLEDTHKAILNQSDADCVLLTGGVSMGDTDFVPEALRLLGAKILFHRIPIRPGRPILAAVMPSGQLIVGLPGNPLSVATTARRFVEPALLKMCGSKRTYTADKHLALSNPDARSLPLTWFRLVRQIDDSFGELIESNGSGDIASLGVSDGFVEMPPEMTGPGPYPFFVWR